MPTYEYECRSCDRIVEVFQSMRDAPLTECPQCGQPGVKRLIGRGAGIIFKGSGFYETDYKRAGAKRDDAGGSEGAAAPASTPAAGAAPAAAPTSTTESKPAETK